jgi:hypothetical protein
LLSDPIRRQQPTEESDIDFARVLRSLSIRGYSLEAISLHANVSSSALHDYLAGTPPLYTHGVRILRLWGETTGNAKVPSKQC